MIISQSIVVDGANDNNDSYYINTYIMCVCNIQ